MVEPFNNVDARVVGKHNAWHRWGSSASFQGTVGTRSMLCDEIVNNSSAQLRVHQHTSFSRSKHLLELTRENHCYGGGYYQ